MRVTAALLAAALAFSMPSPAQNLPDLSGTADSTLSPITERRIGESIMREIRRRDPGYVEDAEVTDYIAAVGARLTRALRGVGPDFEFFVVRDNAINAFALPGGFIGVHTGLLAAAETESELASVLAHEVAHVTQRHVARMFGAQQQMQIPMMVALAAALLLGRSNPDLALGAAAAVQGFAVQNQLGYSRDFEREADRLGFQMLYEAGYDPRGMPEFFQRMQRYTRILDDGSFPAYLRTHPVTSERIADTENRAAAVPYRQHVDTLDFHLVRAKMRALTGDPHDAVTNFESALRERRFANEASARYGLAVTYLRNNRAADAQRELARARSLGASGPMPDLLDAQLKRALGDTRGALAVLAGAFDKSPERSAVAYAYINALQDAGRNADAIKAIDRALRAHPADANLYALQSKSYAGLGKRLLQHQAQAESYRLRGALPAAVEQLELARKAGDGDFYQLSIIEARLRELRTRYREEQRDARR